MGGQLVSPQFRAWGGGGVGEWGGGGGRRGGGVRGADGSECRCMCVNDQGDVSVPDGGLTRAV